MATGAAAVIARARRDIQHHFFSHDAVRPDRAVGFEPYSRFQQRQFERMSSRGIIREGGADTYWLDVVAYDDDLQARHRRVKIALFVAIAALLVMAGIQALRL
jgi:leucyl-tRNA synthetase